jgi:hypothetical protein
MRLTFSKLLKTNVEKMSVFRLSMMLMKTRELKHSLHDVDEKKGIRRLTPSRKKYRIGVMSTGGGNQSADISSQSFGDPIRMEKQKLLFTPGPLNTSEAVYE